MVGIHKPQAVIHLTFYPRIIKIIKCLLTVLSQGEKTEVSLDYCVRRQFLLYSPILEAENVYLLFSFSSRPISSYFLSCWLWKVSPIQLWTFSWSSLRIVNPAICLSSLIRPKDSNNKLKLKKLSCSVRSKRKKPSLPQHLRYCGSSIH